MPTMELRPLGVSAVPKEPLGGDQTDEGAAEFADHDCDEFVQASDIEGAVPMLIPAPRTSTGVHLHFMTPTDDGADLDAGPSWRGDMEEHKVSPRQDTSSGILLPRSSCNRKGHKSPSGGAPVIALEQPLLHMNPFTVNPYVEMLKAYREDRERSGFDLQKGHVSTLAARLGTERQDSLATMTTSEQIYEVEYSDAPYGSMQCGGMTACRESNCAADSAVDSTKILHIVPAIDLDVEADVQKFWQSGVSEAGTARSSGDAGYEVEYAYEDVRPLSQRCGATPRYRDGL